jgi:hypothetical protein
VRLQPALGWLLLSIFAGFLASALQAFEMTRVAEIPLMLSTLAYDYILCGDANHNDHGEVYGRRTGCLDTVYCFENTGGNNYQGFPLFPHTPARLCAYGDGDSDSLFELVTRKDVGHDSCRYVGFESPTYWSFPCESVWQVIAFDPQVRTVGYTDLDRDGRRELVVESRNAGFILFENTGNNRYDSVAVLSCLPGQALGVFDTGDFDQDSLCELVSGGLRIFEATGYDNQYVISAEFPLGDSERSTQIVTAGDMDQDGCPEFVVLSTLDVCARLLIYEATAHAEYRRVWQRQLPIGGLALAAIAVGDADGDGVNELAYTTFGLRQIFKCTGPDSYESVWSSDTGGIHLAFYDLNGNGRDELIVSESSHCAIYEDTEGLAVAVMAKPGLKSRVSVVPTVLRLGAAALFSDIPSDATAEIHGIDGRLVRSQPQVRQSSWTWDLRDQAGNLVPAGTYFAVVRSKGKATSLKLCVVK